MTHPENAFLSLRVNALVALYQVIAATRMEGIPLLNPAVQVEAVGFEPVDIADDDDATPSNQPAAGVGVLITPWFMNLIWLPLKHLDHAEAVGSKVLRYIGPECFEFIGAHENAFGSYQACSLFSPVFEFDQHAAAVATARAVLETLRQPARAALAAAPQAPARRAFLFGRGSIAKLPEKGRAEVGHG